jgi:hypothetical protein
VVIVHYEYEWVYMILSRHTWRYVRQCRQNAYFYTFGQAREFMDKYGLSNDDFFIINRMKIKVINSQKTPYQKRFKPRF